MLNGNVKPSVSRRRKRLSRMWSTVERRESVVTCKGSEMEREREGKKEKKRCGELSVQLRSVSRVHLNRIEGSA